MTPLLIPQQGLSLGTFCFGDVEIKAFGPQALPLSDDLKFFGIKAAPIDNWACSAGLPEIWMEFTTHKTEEESKLSYRFVGLTPETSLGFVFYIKGPSCTIGNETLKPKTLRRFHGEASAVLIQHLNIESSHPHKVEVVPLAGDDSFWGANFLVCFAIHPCIPQGAFLLQNL